MYSDPKEQIIDALKRGEHPSAFEYCRVQYLTRPIFPVGIVFVQPVSEGILWPSCFSFQFLDQAF